ncbi:MAG TPA: biotin/lipoyl-containing protein, partial [Acidimicrobiales bacterium]|nr:biotin/lipoyl-containing protein [Acidimicrobiales bacterium]
MADINMPQLGETVTEGTIIRWLKKVGDAVAIDDPLFEVSTDKVDSEVPSSASGFLTEILVEEGATVDVGTKLAVISAEAGASGGGDSAAPPAPAAEAAPPPPPPPPPAPSQPAPPPPPPPPPVAAVPAVPAAEQLRPEDVLAPVGAGAPVASANGGAGSRVLSPVVRKLIDEHSIDPTLVPGTGAGGRITRGDVLAFIDTRAVGGATTAPAVATPTAVATAAAASVASRAAAPKSYAPSTAGARDELVPFTNIRRRTAEHMVRSKATSAHTLVVAEADYENVEKVRRVWKERFKAEEGISLTYLPFVSRA